VVETCWRQLGIGAGRHGVGAAARRQHGLGATRHDEQQHSEMQEQLRRLWLAAAMMCRRERTEADEKPGGEERRLR
jgi:hypothetical protein